MADYGHDLVFGTFLTPEAGRAQQVVALAELTDRVGLDLVTIQDHPYQPAFLDTWTLLAVIVGRTSRVRVAPNVANLPLRPPAMIARAAASLDILSGGRFELGLGSGAFADAVAGMGGPRRGPGEAVDALEEAIQVIRSLWTPGRGVRFDGRHYQLRGAKPGPVPVHDIGIWLGAYKPRMLRLTGRDADGWLPSAPYLPPDQLAAANEIIDEAARNAGREPKAIRRLYNLIGVGGDFPRGSLTSWPEQLAELAVTQGMSGFLLGGDDPGQVEQFAAEVVPATRELVAKERAGGGTPPAATAVTPTPDDGVRRSPERVWDESTRPTGPGPEPGRVYTAREQATGQHLIEVHDHLRDELTQLRDLIDQVSAGTLDPGDARSELNTMTMRQNTWTLGTYCESYCRVVTIHHGLEDQALFPALRRADRRLVPVIDRLEEEHGVIHNIIEQVDQALVAMVTKPDGLADLRAAVNLLSDALLSHLSYEERELVDPLARLDFQL